MKCVRKRLRQAVALLLVSTFLFLYPLQVSAQNIAIGSDDSTITTTEKSLDNDIDQSYEEPPVIIAELDENRDEITKTFELSNGNKMLVQYDYPVHYLDVNDNWVEYDNRMTEIVENSESQDDEPLQQSIPSEIQTTEADTTQTTDPSQLLENTTEIAISDEEEISSSSSAEVATDFSVDNEMTENSAPLSENNSYESENNTYYDNKASDIDIKLSKKAKQNNMVKLNSDNYKISWGYVDVNKSTIEFIENNKELTGNDKFLTPQNVVQQAIYRNIYDGVDLECLISSVGVKENIIINSSSAKNEFEIAYKFDGLTVSQINDNTVGFYNSANEQVYMLTAPYMMDANGEMSHAVSISVVEQKNKKLTLKVTANKEWLTDSNRVYPVTIDPAFTISQSWEATSSAFVDQSKPNTSFGWESSTGYAGNLCIGTLGYGNFRGYIKVNNLPKLNKGDIIVEAYLNLHLYQNDFYTDMYIGAYHVNGSWNQSTLTWNNQPSFNSAAYDYELFNENTSSDKPWHDWNITTSVKRWYNGEANNGVMIKAVDESNNYQAASFYSSNYPASSTPRALFTIIYRNNKGIEDYWTYSGFNAGTAGQLYVNDYTGNLTFVHSDLGTAGNLMPVSVQHVYNNYMANVKYTKSIPYTGVGWKLNYQQTVLPSSEYGLKGDSASKYPYVYTDGDGTEHYFYKKTENGVTKYLDEDGLKYELTINNKSTIARYTIKDEKDNKMEFNSLGNLKKVIDSNSNALIIEYDSDNKTIKSFKDGAGKSVTYSKNSSGYITKMTDPAGKTITYSYTGNKLTKITYSNGTYITFTYDSDGSITKVTDIDGYRIEITYSSSSSGKRVTAIQEYGTNGSAGQKITFDRSKYNQTVIQTSGVDGDYGTTDDVKTTYQFDQYGRTVSVINKTGTQDMGASVYKFTAGVVDSTASNIKYLNRVSSEFTTASNISNLIKNPSLESTSYWNTGTWNGSNTSTYEFTDEDKYIGEKSLKIKTTAYSGDTKARAYQSIGNNSTLTGGKTYTLSAYVKTDNITSTAENYGAGVCAAVKGADGVYTNYYSEHIKSTTDTAVNDGWRRVTTTFTLPADFASVTVNMHIRAATGTAYFDAIQLEENPSANNFNILTNGDFEYYDSAGTALYWHEVSLSESKTVDSAVTSQHKSGKSSFMITGNPATVKAIYQIVPISGSENDTYIVGGWAKANSVPKDENGKDRDFNISVKILYSDGTSTWKDPAKFNTSISDWQYSSTTFNLGDGTSAKKTPTRIYIYLRYHNQCNKVYFDNIQLIKDATQSYTYNSDGELVTVKDNAEQQSKLEYNNSDLTKSIDPKGYAYTYEYDDNHNMTKATSQRGLVYNYTYDSKGNATSLSAENSDGTIALRSTAEYTSNKAFLTKTTDQDGIATTYNYDQNSGLLLSAQDSATTMSYTYDEDTNQLESVTAKWNGLGEENVTNTYSYTPTTGRNLTQISHNGTNYNIEYDAFNNKTNTLVGNQSLAQYNYDSNNGILQSVTYGNGNTISYAYNNYGNTSIQKNNGKTAFKWFSDRSGGVTRQDDYINNTQTNYEYDTTGRLVRQSEIDISQSPSSDRTNYMLEYGYDLNNNITKLVHITPNSRRTLSYAYGKDNLPSTFTIKATRKVNYSYDGLSRLTATTISTETPIKMAYQYHLSKRNTGSSQLYRTTKVYQETIGEDVYHYYYDDSGNITQIDKKINGSFTTIYKYEYDSFGQLIYERNYENDTSKHYDYDEGGNLWGETTNYYAGSTSGAPSKTENIFYDYSDTNWTDKMTSYNGQTITYDEIGNPLSYRDGMTMTWQNGRQLATLQKDGNNIQYSYDSDGVRVSKTVNGEKRTYTYLNGLLICETRGDKFFNYSYDANGTLYAVSYKLNPNGQEFAYYYTHNWRGDIVGIYNGNGELRAKYTYDSWGNVTSITDGDGNAVTSPTHVGNLNPFRYRGYYMDTETGFYYLMSRYYDPVTHRFLNADGYFQTGLGILDPNMNAYCKNNPINCVDPTGTKCHALEGGRSGPECPFNLKTGYCMVCHKKDCCYPKNTNTVTQKVAKKGVNFPKTGTPNSRVYDSNGNWRQYGSNSKPKYDYHNGDHGNPKNHPHGILNPSGEHMHEWGYDENGNYKPGPCLPWQGSEEETLKQGSNQISWDYAPEYDFGFEMPYFNPPTGEKPFWERIWQDITHGW